MVLSPSTKSLQSPLTNVETGTSAQGALAAYRKNIKGLPQAATWGGLFSGLLVVLVSTTGPLAILFQAASAGHLSKEMISSWLLMIFLGSGLFSLILSLRHGMPIIGAWGSATTALLVTGLPEHSFSQVIGAYFVASIVLLIVGVTKTFDSIMKLVPRPVVMAMLAGILFRFGVGVFTSLSTNLILGLSMIFAFFIGRRYGWRAPVVAALAVGLVVAGLQSQLTNPHIALALAKPVWTTPTFEIG
ncbi:MAG: benzoate transporter, partial [Actinobacteria bacterium]|nr:benzoate transporter [Actinomycetota bacterium]